MPFVRTMPFPSSHNANCAPNAIYAICTMPIVHTMPFMQAIQCHLCTQCQLCTQCHLFRPHNANCAHNANYAAHLALCGCIFGIVWLHIWHYVMLYYICIVLHVIALYGVAWYCIVGFGARAVSRKTPTYFIFCGQWSILSLANDLHHWRLQ